MDAYNKRKESRYLLMFEFNNQKYNSIAEFAKQYQITKTAAINRLLSNATFNVEHINDQLVEKQKQQQLEINGVIYNSLRDAANKHDMPEAQLKYNLSMFGYKTDLVFDTHISEPVMPYYSLNARHQMSHYRLNSYHYPVTLNNIKFESIYYACHYAKITQQRLLTNIKNIGTKSKHVFDMHTMESRHKVELDNLVFASKTQMTSLLWAHNLPVNYLLKTDPNALIDPDRLVDVNYIKGCIPFYALADFTSLINKQVVTFTHGRAMTKLKPILHFYHSADFLK